MESFEQATAREAAAPLFKGCTRVPTVAGVPMMPLILMCMLVGILGMQVSLWCYLLAAPLWFVMFQITKHDDRAFRIWALWFETKVRNSNKAFWKASSYGPADYRKRRFE